MYLVRQYRLSNMYIPFNMYEFTYDEWDAFYNSMIQHGWEPIANDFGSVVSFQSEGYIVRLFLPNGR